MAHRLAERLRKHPMVLALGWGLIPSLLAFSIAPIFETELKKAIYTGAATLFFGGLLGGLLKILLDEIVVTKRRREDAANFIANVLADMKGVYDRVGRARTLIPAHRSVKTYGEEMRDLIEARVQLRNLTRALERRTEGDIDKTVRDNVMAHVQKMGGYFETLTTEFRDNFKGLSDQQRGYEERTKVVLKRYAEKDDEGDPPKLPEFVWKSLSTLPRLADFIGDGCLYYKKDFETPLDDASQCLRDEHARILRGEPVPKKPAQG